MILCVSGNTSTLSMCSLFSFPHWFLEYTSIVTTSSTIFSCVQYCKTQRNRGYYHAYQLSHIMWESPTFTPLLPHVPHVTPNLPHSATSKILVSCIINSTINMLFLMLLFLKLLNQCFWFVMNNFNSNNIDFLLFYIDNMLKLPKMSLKIML